MVHQESCVKRTEWLTGAKGHPQHNDPFSRKSIRRALVSWNNSRELGEHPLARLDAVETQRRAAGYGDTPTGYGAALRAVLSDTLATLRPDVGEPNCLEKRWRLYMILKGQYIEGRSPDYLAEQLCIGRSTYYREQVRALDILANTLYEQEWVCSVRGATTTSVISRVRAFGHPHSHQIPFLAPSCPPHNLVGRDDLLRNLKQRLLAGGNLALSALNGLPGVGKTALAIELANDPQVLAHFQDGVLWTGLGRQPDVLALLGMWGAALDIPSSEMAKLISIKDRTKAIHAAIGMRRMLLVVDDAWETEAALAFKLGGPNCAHLVTTRIPEVALEFAGRGIIVVRELSKGDGLALLAQLAPKVVEAKPDQARTLVQAVGGLPLALTLMGRYLRKETHCVQPRRLHKALDQLCQAEIRLRLAQPQTMLERHPDLPADVPLSLITAIGISDKALDEASRRALYALSVFPSKPNSFSEEAALVVSAASASVLDTLVDYGLLECGEPDRYTLHQTIADYASMELADEAAHERMVAFYVRYIETHETDYGALDLETENILAALQAAFNRGMQVELVQGTNAFYDYLDTRGLYTLAKVHLKRAEQVARANGNTLGLATILKNLGQTMLHLGDYADAEAIYQEGLALAHKSEDLGIISDILRGLGIVASNRGDYVQAEAFCQQGLTIDREIGNRRGESAQLGNLGNVYYCLGQMEVDGNRPGAIEYYRQALAIAQEIDDRPGEGRWLGSLGNVYIVLGQVERAIEYYEQVLVITREIGHRQTESNTLSNLGNAYRCLGQMERAIEYHKQALAIAQEIGHRQNESYTLLNLGLAYHDLGQIERAIEYHRQALTIAREISHRQTESIALSGLGTAYSVLGQVEQAIEYHKQALDIVQEIGDRLYEGEHLTTLGAAYHSLGQAKRAIECYEQALAITREIGDRRNESIALSGLEAVYHSLR